MITERDIELDEATHTYRINGEVWPGVTEILDAEFDSYAGVPAETLKAAADWGTAVDQTIEFWCDGDLDEATLQDPLPAVLEQFKQALHESKAEPVAWQVKVAHPILRYCGKLDLLVRIRRAIYQWDVKTGIMTPNWGPQTAAYDAALTYTEIGDRFAGIDCREIRWRAALHLDQGSHTLIQLKDQTDFSVFSAALVCQRHKQRLLPIAKRAAWAR